MSAPRPARAPLDSGSIARRSRAAYEQSRRRRSGNVAAAEDIRKRRRLTTSAILAAVAFAAFLTGAIAGGSQTPARSFKTATASTFATYGDPLACGGSLEPNQLGVASKTLPCGSKVTIKNGKHTITVPVIDRGPYVAGRDFDLTQATADELHFNGLGPIRWAKG